MRPGRCPPDAGRSRAGSRQNAAFQLSPEEVDWRNFPKFQAIREPQTLPSDPSPLRPIGKRPVWWGGPGGGKQVWRTAPPSPDPRGGQLCTQHPRHSVLLCLRSASETQDGNTYGKSHHLLFPLAKLKNCATISFFFFFFWYRHAASAELAELARSQKRCFGFSFTAMVLFF